MNGETRELIIIGGGPAGYTAALYAARANLEPLVIEGFAWGGQLMITSDVENYPGYPDGIMGPAMMQDFRRQAERFGAEFLTDDVTKVDFTEHPLRVWVGDQEFTAESAIVATGASARQLGLESERTLQGRGVSYCAVCDAAFFRDKQVVVVGGGRLRDGGGDLPDEVRYQGDARPPAQRFSRLADHDRPRPGK
jgi:thioredoxin reductase (NADPH)